MIIFLVITACFIKYHSFTDINVKAATVKFGFFLLLGNGVNLLVQFTPIIIPLLGVFDKQKLDHHIYTAYKLLNSALIPTPILITIYFKPIQKRLWHWLCCWILKERMVKHLIKKRAMQWKGAEVSMVPRRL